MQPDRFPLPQQLALAHSGGVTRQLLASFFELDNKFASFVSQAKEPMLAQMRIAWWRDQLAKPVGERPQGEPLLARLAQLWAGEEIALSCLADGWEVLLAEPPLEENAASTFAVGRATCFAAIARLVGRADASEAAYAAGFRWANADLLSRLSDAEERDYVLKLIANNGTTNSKLPYALRAMRILDALASKSILRGGSPLIIGRLEIMMISRIGLLGR